MKKLLHFVIVVKTWLRIKAKNVTIILVNFALLITKKTLYLPKIMKHRKCK